MTESKLSRRAGLAAGFAAIAFIANRAFGQPPPPGQPRPMAVPPAVVHERERILNDVEIRLREARDLLFRAGHEYGGHRMQAIHMIDGAMAETGVARRFLV